MRYLSFRIKTILLIGILFLSASPLYASTAEDYNDAGIDCSKQGKYTEAIVEFTMAIELNPRFGMAYYNRGMAYQRQSNYTQAISDYTRAIEINPNDAAAYNNCGAAYTEQGKVNDPDR